MTTSLTRRRRTEVLRMLGDHDHEREREAQLAQLLRALPRRPRRCQAGCAPSTSRLCSAASPSRGTCSSSTARSTYSRSATIFCGTRRTRRMAPRASWSAPCCTTRWSTSAASAPCTSRAARSADGPKTIGRTTRGSSSQCVSTSGI